MFLNEKDFFKLNAVSAILTLLWVSSNLKAKKYVIENRLKYAG